MGARPVSFVLAALLWSGCGGGGSASDLGPTSCPATDSTGCGRCWTSLSQTTLGVSQSTIDFGTQAIGSSTDRTITVTNAGDVASGVVTRNISASPFGFKDGGTCNGALAPGQSCAIVLSFAPMGDPGMTFTGTVTLQWARGFQCDNGSGGGPQAPTLQISLSGSD